MADQFESLRDFIKNRRSRRKFLTQSGLLGLGALSLTQLHGFASVGKSAQGANQGITDVNILNFALNLEYLEAEFYLIAAFGRRLSPADVTGIGPLGPVIGGRQVAFESDIIRQYAEEIAEDEEAHVRFIRAALGSAAVARPTIDIGPAFTAAAVAAGIIPPGGTFDPYANDVNFLLAAFIFEDVGVTAYKGAARFIVDKDILEAAAGLLAVEAYHAGEIRTVLYGRNAVDPGLMIAANVQKISDLRDSVDGPDDRDQGIIRSRGSFGAIPIGGGPFTFNPTFSARGRANIVPADENGLAYSRTIRQVLNIVYLGGDTSGGFFPNGVNAG
ncbi:MAG: ferritin-like domain-containing protein [Acidobacteria bacterium]|nr:ferritin-like domain-containing protein [Acidobacteriota bacterium]MCA1608623.1 ferritin-like domain-containing protein [Acidobacteriota bacterium]